MAAAGGASLSAGAADAVIVGEARANNRTDLVTFTLRRAEPGIGELRLRSGHLAIVLVAVEVEFVDGTLARRVLEQSLAPGQQSAPIAVDPGRAIASVLVTKRPGLREGETLLQLLARRHRRPATE